ncbi:MAG: response regulator [Bacteroidota bacterium]|nr:response regulator [Bacteroidota bacterium]
MNKLLIIDDDEDVSAMLFLLLRKDFDVAVATRSEDIFPKIKSFYPDIILLDVFLKGYDGRVICKQLKFHPDSKHIPVIMVSGHDDVSETVEQYGANDFIQKPFDAETLLTKINTLLKLNAKSA